MKPEIIVLIVTSIITLITVVANIIVTTRIAGKQNKIELKKTRIEVLESRRHVLEKAKDEISKRFIDVGGENSTDPKILFPKIVNNFQQNASTLSSVGHFLNFEFVTKIEELGTRINQYIFNDKNRQPSDETQKNKDIKLLYTINKELSDEITIVLRKIETEIETLIKN